jgi:hypothetical protein
LAAVVQPITPTGSVRRAVFLAAVFVALGLPARASAHGTALVNATDYEARITSVGGVAEGLRARVIDGDRKLELSVPRSHTVVVLGDAAEPFLRFSGDGVAVNDRSPTALTNKLARSGSVPSLDPHAAPRWRHLSSRTTYRWHDHRLGPLPGRRYATGAVARWSIPIVVDGRRTAVTGSLWHARGPSAWIWVALIAVSLAAAVALARLLRGRALRALVVASAGVSGSAALLLGLALALGAQGTSGWGSFAMSVFAVVVAAFVYARARGSRYALVAPGLAALYMGIVGLSNFGVLVHGYVISSFPSVVVRAAAGGAICAGIVAATATVADVAHLDRDAEHGAKPDRGPRRMAVPRGRAR